MFKFNVFDEVLIKPLNIKGIIYAIVITNKEYYNEDNIQYEVKYFLNSEPKMYRLLGCEIEKYEEKSIVGIIK